MTDRDHAGDRRRTARLCRRRAAGRPPQRPSRPGSPPIRTMPRASPRGARRPTRSARATARSPTSRCRRGSISTAWRAPAARGRMLAAAAVLVAFLVGGVGGWVGARRLQPPAAVTVPTVHRGGARGPQALHRRGAPSGRGAGRTPSHLVQWLSKRVGYQLRAPDLAAVRPEAGRRPAAAGPRRPAAFFMYESTVRRALHALLPRAPTGRRRRCATACRARSRRSTGSTATSPYVVSGPADRDRSLKIAQTAYEQLDRRTDARGDVVSRSPHVLARIVGLRLAPFAHQLVEL